MELRHVWSRWCIYRIPKNRRKEFDIGRTLWISEWLKSQWIVHQQRLANIRIGSITIITSPCFLLSEEHCIQGSRGKVLNNPLLCYDFMMKTMFLIWFHVENNVFDMTSCWKQCFHDFSFSYIDSPGGFFSRQRLDGEEEEGDDNTVEMNHDHLHLIVMKWRLSFKYRDSWAFSQLGMYAWLIRDIPKKEA